MKLFLPAVLVGLSLASGAIAAPAQANSFTLDFETDADGNALDAQLLDGAGQNGFSTTNDNIGDIWSSIGITITDDSNAPLGLFNSNCVAAGGTSANGFTTACNINNSLGDPDLATGTGSYGNISYDSDPQGNLLIFEENAGNGTPDDTSSGGTIKFDFDLDNILSSVKLQEIGIVDDASGTLTVNFLDNTTFTQTIDIDNENELKFFSLSDADQAKEIRDFSVQFNGSGGITGVAFAEFKKIPEPMTLWGIAVVAGAGLGLKRRSVTQ